MSESNGPFCVDCGRLMERRWVKWWGNEQYAWLCPVCPPRSFGGRQFKFRCIACREEFLAHSPLARYCSDKCIGMAKKARASVRKQTARQKKCGHCSAAFAASRADAKFCSNACRQARYRYILDTYDPVGQP